MWVYSFPKEGMKLQSNKKLPYILTKLCFILVTILFLSGCVVHHAGQKSDMEIKLLKKSVQARLDSCLSHAVFSVAFKNLDTGEEILINEHENFHAASTMKTPVMVEVFKQAAAGNFSLGDSIVIKNRFKSIVDSSEYSLNSGDDSQTDLYNKVGTKSTIYDLMYQMIILSSNLATNIIIDLVDAIKVNQTMHDLGAKNIRVLRGVEDQKAYEDGLNNTTTALDQLIIYEKIALGKIVNRPACEKMIDILDDQKLNSIIPSKLPIHTRVAHKTGNITGVDHDAGIVFLPDGKKYVLVLLSKEVKVREEAIEAMADVSKIIYDSMSGSSK